jgi:xylulokinase
MDRFLGIDIGTTAVKAAVIDADGSLAGDAEVAIETPRPREGWSEQDPDAWVSATQRALAELAQRLPGGFSNLSAVGFSGQMHGLVPLGPDKLPLRPAILWNDNRASAEAAKLNAHAPDLAERLGLNQ